MAKWRRGSIPIFEWKNKNGDGVCITFAVTFIRDTKEKNGSIQIMRVGGIFATLSTYLIICLKRFWNFLLKEERISCSLYHFSFYRNANTCNSIVQFIWKMLRITSIPIFKQKMETFFLFDNVFHLIKFNSIQFQIDNHYENSPIWETNKRISVSKRREQWNKQERTLCTRKFHWNRNA